jgi:hypothetical protein
MQIDPSDRAAVDVLIGGLSDADGKVRYLSALALGSVDRIQAGRVASALTAALYDDDPRVRSMAAESLAVLSPNGPGHRAERVARGSGAARPVDKPTAGTSLEGSPSGDEAISVSHTRAATKKFELGGEKVLSLADALKGADEPAGTASEASRSAQPDTPPLPQGGPGAQYDGDGTAPLQRRPAVERNQLLKPMRDLTADIAVAEPDAGTEDTVTLPSDPAREQFEAEGVEVHFPGMSRSWWMPPVCWDASAACHRPLYFEDVNLERYGHNFGCVQPVISAGKFFGTLPLLPYLMFVEPQHCCADCTYTLGHYRPGTGAPHRHHCCLPCACDSPLVESAVCTMSDFLKQ